jgi:hypothetical protein
VRNERQGHRLRTGGDDCLLKADRSITIAPDLNAVRRGEPAIESLQGVRCLRRAARTRPIKAASVKKRKAEAEWKMMESFKTTLDAHGILSSGVLFDSSVRAGNDLPGGSLRPDK